MMKAQEAAKSAPDVVEAQDRAFKALVEGIKPIPSIQNQQEGVKEKVENLNKEVGQELPHKDPKNEVKENPMIKQKLENQEKQAQQQQAQQQPQQQQTQQQESQATQSHKKGQKPQGKKQQHKHSPVSHSPVNNGPIPVPGSKNSFQKEPNIPSGAGGGSLERKPSDGERK
jgi:DNA polymerase sigma